MKNQTNAHPTAEDILNDIRTLGNDAKQLFADRLQEPAADAVEAIRARMSAARENLSDYYETAREKTISGGKAADRSIRTHPYQSIAIAAGVGLVIGLLIARDND